MKNKKKKFDPINLDSLLDTLCCVVGILIILMVFSQLGVVSSNKEKTQPRASLITDEDINIKVNKLSDLESELKMRRERWGIIEVKIPEWQEKELVLQKEIEKLKQSFPNFNDIDCKLLSAQETFVKLEFDEKNISNEVIELRNRLDGMQEDALDKAKTSSIRVPEINDPPTNLIPVYFICRYGKIYPFEDDKINKEFVKFISHLRESDISSTINRDTIFSYFNQNDIGDTFFKIILDKIIISPRLYLQLELIPRKENGETIQQIKKDDSCFARSIKKLDPREKYINFRVYEDSYDVYLMARNIAESYHSALGPDNGSETTLLYAGWEPCYIDEKFLFVYPSRTKSTYRPKID